MLVEESIGVRLPRHLNSLIAQIPGVGAAFAMMLPLAGVAAAIAIVVKLIDKHKEYEERLYKNSIAANESAVKNADLTKSLELENLKLDDQIAKLEHKPAKNYIAEAIIESSKAIDDFAGKATADFAKMDVMIKEQLGTWAEFKRFIKEELSGDVQGGRGGANTKQWEDLKDKITAVSVARAKLAEAPMDKASQLAGQQAVIKALENEKAAVAVLMVTYRNDKDALVQLSAQYADTAEAIKGMGIAQEVAGKKQTVGALTQNKENLDNLKEVDAAQKKVIDNTLAQNNAEAKHKDMLAQIADAETKGNVDQSPEQKAANAAALAQSEYEDAIAKAKSTFEAKKAINALEVDENKGNDNKLKDLDAELSGYEIARAAAVAEAKDALNLKSAQAKATALAEEQRREKAAAQEEADDNLKNAIDKAKLQEKQAAQTAKDLEALHKKTADETLAATIKATNDERNAEVKAYEDRIKALDKFSADYQKNYKKFEDAIKKINQDADAQIVTDTKSAMQKQVLAVTEGETKMEQSVADNVSKTIVSNKNFAQSMRQTGEQLLETMISNLIMAEIFQQKSKLISANKAAATAWGEAPNPIVGAIVAAASWAGVMAYEQGGKIPGEGAVPIIGHGGETVVTRALTQRVEQAERGNGGGSTLHYHDHSNFSAVDAEGMDRLMTKHRSLMERHIASAVRRMNK
jgi:hypothetical protein